MSAVKVGDRVRMVGIMRDDPAPMEMGAEGTVTWINRMHDGRSQIAVDWDNGRSLMLLSTDPYVVLTTHEITYGVSNSATCTCGWTGHGVLAVDLDELVEAHERGTS